MESRTDSYAVFSASENNVLRSLIQEGILSEEIIESTMRKKKEKYVEEHHCLSIHLQERKDGKPRWTTHVYCDTKEGRKRKLVAKTSRDDLVDFLYDYYTGGMQRKNLNKVSIDSLFDRWIEHKKLHGISESTIIKYMSDWKCHLKGTEIAEKPICLITAPELDEWAHRLIMNNHMTRKDYVNVSTLVRQPLDYACTLGIIDHNPMNSVKIESRMFKPVRKKRSETQVYSPDELDAVKIVAWNDLDNSRLVYKLAPLAFLFMFQTGLRIGEACAVKFDDIEGNELHVQRTVMRDTHTIKDGLKGVATERWVILSSEAKRIIDEARKRREELGCSDAGFIFSITDECLSYRALDDCFRRYCDLAGIPFKSSHKARKTFISSLLDAGMNINTVREMVGHAEESTTLNSYHYDRATKDRRMEILEKALER